MIGLLIEALTDTAEFDNYTGREIHPSWVLYVLGGAAFLAVFGAWASVG